MVSEGVLLLQMLIQHFRPAGFSLEGARGGVVQHDHKGEVRIGGKLRVFCHCWCRNIEICRYIQTEQVWHEAQLVSEGMEGEGSLGWAAGGRAEVEQGRTEGALPPEWDTC